MPRTIYEHDEFVPFILAPRLLSLLNRSFHVALGSWPLFFLSIVYGCYVRVCVTISFRDFSELAGATFYFDLALGHVRHEILRIRRNNRYCLDEH